MQEDSLGIENIHLRSVNSMDSVLCFRIAIAPLTPIQTESSGVLPRLASRFPEGAGLYGS